MTAISSLCGAALICAAMSLIARNLGSRAAGVIVCVAVAGFFSVAISALSELYGGILAVIDGSGISEYAEATVKIIGVGYLSSAVSEICTELGEGTLARALTMCARVEILLIALPYFVKIINLAIELLG